MKKSLYEYAIAASKANRRTFLKGAAGAGAVAAMSGGLSSIAGSALADGHELRSAILKIPGVGVGSPTDADWQKVGGMCLGPTKERVAEGEHVERFGTFLLLLEDGTHLV